MRGEEMQEVIKEYIEYLKATKKLSDNTLQAYRRDINKYQVYLERGTSYGYVF